MRLRTLFSALLCSLLLNTACGPLTRQFPPLRPPVPAPVVVTPTPEPPAPAMMSFDLNVCAADPVNNTCPQPLSAPAVFNIQQPGSFYHAWFGNGDGYVLVTMPVMASTRIVISAPGYVTRAIEGFDGQACNNGCHNIYRLDPDHVDPSTFDIHKLANIRGAMWPQGPAGCSIPMGPRPGQADNIIATDFITEYDPPTQDCLISELRRRGYTHVVMGPIVDSDGYHGIYTPNDWRGANFERFLDAMQKFWDAGLAPIVFIHPDNWSLTQTQELTPLFTTARAQRLMRIVVPTGWEPTRYGWSSCTWAAFAQWARQTWPNALVLIHTVGDVDAPVGTDNLCDDNGHPNGEGWTRVAPFVHGWLIQNGQDGGAYRTGPAAQPQLATNFAAQFQADGEGANQHSIAWHFVNGVAGWPTFSAWGNTPILLYAGEQTSYTAFWQHITEPDREAWGNLCKQQPYCAGYLDGGTK